jgi:hypothetical protein
LIAVPYIEVGGNKGKLPKLRLLLWLADAVRIFRKKMAMWLPAKFRPKRTPQTGLPTNGKVALPNNKRIDHEK